MALESNRVGVRSDQVDTFGRVTSPSFLNELLDCLPEWTDMPVYKGGTEQILPSNTSVPTTSPIVADIKYPDGMRTNQVFTYRETPAEVDGLAKIKSIKGNTLVWNQLVQNGNFASTSGWTSNNSTISATNNVLSFTATAQYGQVFQNIYNVANHTFLLSFEAKSYTNTNTSVYLRQQKDGTYTQDSQLLTTEWKRYYIQSTCDADVLFVRAMLQDNNESDWGEILLRNVNIYDITKMFGAGKEPTAEQFTSLFPLTYYTYNTGTLLNFNGTAIKTTELNQWDEEWELGGYSISNGTKQVDNSRIRCKNFIYCFPGERYSIASPSTIILLYYDGGYNYLNYIGVTNNLPFTVPANARFMTFYVATAYGTTYKNDICISISSNHNGEYEPYTPHTTNLPKTDYYPTGLKSAGSVYDELTPRKAEIRVGTVDLGSLNWIHRSELLEGLFSVNVTNTVLYKLSSTTQFMSARYASGGVVTAALLAKDKPDKTICIYYTSESTDRYIYIKDLSFNNADTLKQALSGVYLNYELATPVELPTLEIE